MIQYQDKSRQGRVADPDGVDPDPTVKKIRIRIRPYENNRIRTLEKSMVSTKKFNPFSLRKMCYYLTDQAIEEGNVSKNGNVTKERFFTVYVFFISLLMYMFGSDFFKSERTSLHG